MPFIATILAQPWARKLAFWGAIALAVLLVYLRLENQSKKLGALAEKLDAANATAKAEKVMLNEVERANAAAARTAGTIAAAPDGLPEHDPFRRD